MTKVELQKRKSDGKWVRWELLDSHLPNGIGHSATWPRWKWVVTGVWDKEEKPDGLTAISEPCFHAFYEGQLYEEIEN